MKRVDKYESEKQEITAIYHENKGRYGYRRITAELRNRKLPLNHKDGPAAYEGIGPGLPCPNEEVSFLQGRSRQNRTKLTESGLPCGQAESEMGHGCDGVQPVRRKSSICPRFSICTAAIWSVIPYPIHSARHRGTTTREEGGRGAGGGGVSFRPPTRKTAPAKATDHSRGGEGVFPRGGPKGKLSGQRCDREFLRTAQK